MKNAKYLGNWWRDFHEIFRVFLVIPRIPMQRMDGSAHPILGEEVGKLNLWPHISKMGGPGGLEIFCAVGASEYSKMKS